MLYITLRAHEKIHTRGNERPFSCSQCGRSFLKRHSLRNHEFSVHGHVTDLYCPPPCSKRFASVAEMTSHILALHSAECDDMTPPSADGDVTRTDNDDAAAAFVHAWLVRSNQRALTCDKCACTFKTVRRLYAHNVTHHRERHLTCDQCGKGMIASRRLYVVF